MRPLLVDDQIMTREEFFASRSASSIAKLIGISPEKLSQTFDYENVWPDMINVADKVKDIRYRYAEGVLILLGRRVARTFGCDLYRFFEPVRWGTTTIVVLPHLSSRSRWWNDGGNRSVASVFMRGLVTGLRA